MNGRDVWRRVSEARRAAKESLRMDALRRLQPGRTRATAQDCVNQGRDPARKAEPMRRAAGAPQH